jgi:hypothetical protein
LFNNSKYSIINEDGSVLIIKNLMEKDAGGYDCVAVNKIGESRASAELKIFSKTAYSNSIIKNSFLCFLEF